MKVITARSTARNAHAPSMIARDAKASIRQDECVALFRAGHTKTGIARLWKCTSGNIRRILYRAAELGKLTWDEFWERPPRKSSEEVLSEKKNAFAKTRKLTGPVYQAFEAVIQAIEELANGVDELGEQRKAIEPKLRWRKWSSSAKLTDVPSSNGVVGALGKFVRKTMDLKTRYQAWRERRRIDRQKPVPTGPAPDHWLPPERVRALSRKFRDRIGDQRTVHPIVDEIGGPFTSYAAIRTLFEERDRLLGEAGSGNRARTALERARRLSLLDQPQIIDLVWEIFSALHREQPLAPVAERWALTLADLPHVFVRWDRIVTTLRTAKIGHFSSNAA